MKTIPTAIKIILNLIFFIVYSVITIFLVGFVLTNIFNIGFNDADKVGYVAIVFAFIITFIFRKFFYISLKNN